jgi:hypothetical protein
MSKLGGVVSRFGELFESRCEAPEARASVSEAGREAIRVARFRVWVGALREGGAPAEAAVEVAEDLMGACPAEATGPREAMVS